jgi:hypothetical protein
MRVGLRTGIAFGSLLVLGTAAYAARALSGAPPAAHPIRPPLVIRGVPVAGTPRQVIVHVENTGAAPLSLRRNVTVARREGNAWHEVGAAGLLLRRSCADPEPSRCVTLAPGASLDTAPWTGTTGDAQCVCTRCGPAPAGSYRFDVTTCAGLNVSGAEFSLPAP